MALLLLTPPVCLEARGFVVANVPQVQHVVLAVFGAALHTQRLLRLLKHWMPLPTLNIRIIPHPFVSPWL